MSVKSNSSEILTNEKIIEEKKESSSESKKSSSVSISSSKSSKKSSIKEKPVKPEINSDEIDVSQMELIANKKKLNKKSSIVDDISIKKAKPSSSSSSDSSSSSSDTKVEYNDKKKKKNIKKENNNEYIRKEKSELLYKFNKIHLLEKWSSLKFDMNNSLEEIKNEYERVTNAIKVDRSVRFLKRMLLLGVQGIEMLNSKFDPLGVDLDGWGEAMSYNMETQDYDEVMAELYEKYKSAGNMSPELKLILMIVSSAAFFTISKKLTSTDSQNGMMNMINNLISQQQQQQQQQFQPQQQRSPQQLFQQQQQQSRNFDTTEDNTPSKMNDPQKIQDTIALNNILDTMKKRQQEKNDMSESNMSMSVSENKVISSIGAKKRGRPSKKVNK